MLVPSRATTLRDVTSSTSPSTTSSARPAASRTTPSRAIGSARPSSADWDRVIELGSDLLRRLTKDLQIAAWMTEALARSGGSRAFATDSSSSASSRSASGTPIIPKSRTATSNLVPDRFSSSIRPSPSSFGVSHSRPAWRGHPYSFLRWKEAIDTDNVGRMGVVNDKEKRGPSFRRLSSPRGRSRPKSSTKPCPRRLDSFTPPSSKMGRRFTRPSRPSIAQTMSDCNRYGPSLTGIGKALEDFRMVLEPIVQAKCGDEPSTDDEVEPEGPSDGGKGKNPTPGPSPPSTSRSR